MEENTNAKKPSNVLAIFLFSIFTALGFVIWLYSPLVTLIFLFIMLSGGFVVLFAKPNKVKTYYVGLPLFGLLSSSVYCFFALGDIHKSEGPSLEERADAGDPDAQYTAGLFGIVTKNDKSLEYIHSSAEQGNAKAQYMLALLLARSQHEIAHPHAYKWLIIARDNGHSDATEMINALLPKISEEDKALGRKLASEWKPSAIKTPNKSSNLIGVENMPPS